MTRPPGIACRYRPDPSLPGVPAVMLGIQGRYVLVEFEDHGTLETAEGYLRRDFRFRRHKWVPQAHCIERGPFTWVTGN